MRVSLLPWPPSRSSPLSLSRSSSPRSPRARCLNCVVCQLAPSPLLWPISSRLQLNPLKPAARSAAGTWPCSAVSGLSCGPHTAFGTVTGMGLLSESFLPPSAPTKTIDEKNTAPIFSDVPTQRFITANPPLVLLAGRRTAVLERPHPFPELQREHAVVLASRPQRAALGVQVRLRRAPVRTARLPVRTDGVVVGARARGRRASRVVVGDLLRPQRITDVEHADTGVEHSTDQGGRMMLVVDAAVMRPVREDGEPHEVRQHLGTVLGIMHLVHDLGDDLRVFLVADVDDARHRERRHAGRACSLQLSGARDATRAAFIDEDHVWLALDLHRNRVLRGGAVLPVHLADHLRLRVRLASLDVA